MILDNKLYFKGSLLLYGLLVLFSCKSDDVVPTEQEEQQEEIEVAPQDRLPQVFIDTKGASIVDEPKISSDAVMVVANDTVYQGNLGIEFRGATSQGFPKKSYGLETWDANDEDTDVALLGFPEEEDWILYGPYSDKSLMRNVLIYDLSRDMERYASRTLFVDLTLNDVYQGVYVFMEKLKRDGERIDINRLRDDENSGEDVTGGYILKIDKTAGNNLGEGYNDLNSITSLYAPTNATLGQQIHFLYEYPDAEDITMAQKEYIATYMANFEAALASDTFADAETGYANFIDVQSFIDFFILNELANNVDGYRLSTFMYKDKNEKLKMGPIWDFNLAFGNADYCGGGASNVWAYRFNERCPQDFWQVPFWWDRLLQDPAFVAQLQERWTGLRANLLSNAAIDAKISGYVENLQDAGAVDRNFATWPVLGTYIWPNNFVGDTYMEEVDYLQNWVRNRLSWLDSEISTL
ncbi:Fibronectin type III domain protein [Croceitalea dokdonensis DOKDO 023]|uniref:Fibronectin type III domain protein n=1 Tax=Croceitalea dokdonensis DOKDO 023 TaxID=1300341 RepID=A0A0N8H3T8_9FLAO|nr:CotH kinase family protein [Croceitalea dokdonensis]KPM31492.1 Fibronectin type III domain protein [Croceitalea dokdonensis DOKDO 023]